MAGTKRHKLLDLAGNICRLYLLHFHLGCPMNMSVRREIETELERESVQPWLDYPTISLLTLLVL